MKKFKVFIACDTNKISKAKEIMEKTKTDKIIVGYKFGLESINSKNFRVFLEKLKNEIVFLDLKLHDIPNTCKSAVNAIKDLNVNYLTIHIGSGLNALQAVKKVSKKIKIVGVSTLTSLNNKDMIDIGYKTNVKNLVIKQAKLAKRANLDAIVCSAQEAPLVKKYFSREIITPGIKLNNAAKDQKRVMSPKNAWKNGSDWLVIGRSITNGNIKKNMKKLFYHLKTNAN